MTVAIRARIDEKTRDEAAAVLDGMGLTVSDAFRLMMVSDGRRKAPALRPRSRPMKKPSRPWKPRGAMSWSPSAASMRSWPI